MHVQHANTHAVLLAADFSLRKQSSETKFGNKVSSDSHTHRTAATEPPAARPQWNRCNRHMVRQLASYSVLGRFEGLANQSLRRMSSLTRGDHNSRSSINGVNEAGVPNSVTSKLKGQSQKVVNANSAIEAKEAAAKPGYAPSNRVVPVVSSDEVTALEDNGAQALHALHAED